MKAFLTADKANKPIGSVLVDQHQLAHRQRPAQRHECDPDGSGRLDKPTPGPH
jgi:hypothetical protein